MSDLFCYGTLCVASTMRRIIGRVPDAVVAELPGFARYAVRGENYPAIVPEQGMSTDGVLYRHLSDAELNALDRYEGEEYTREIHTVTTQAGAELHAWVYVFHPQHRPMLSREGWSLNSKK